MGIREINDLILIISAATKELDCKVWDYVENVESALISNQMTKDNLNVLETTVELLDLCHHNLSSIVKC